MSGAEARPDKAPDGEQRDSEAETRLAEPVAQSISATLQALSDPRRLLIAVYLARGESSLSELHRFLSFRGDDLAREISCLVATGLACEKISNGRPVYAIRCDKNRRFIEIIGKMFDL